MPFLKLQHKITGKLCYVGKIWRQNRVEDTIPLQSMLKLWSFFDNSNFFLARVKKVSPRNSVFLKMSTYNHGKTVWFREKLKATSCLGHLIAPDYIKKLRVLLKNIFFFGQRFCLIVGKTIMNTILRNWPQDCECIKDTKQSYHAFPIVLLRAKHAGATVLKM